MKNKTCKSCNACKQLYDKVGYLCRKKYKLFYCTVKKETVDVKNEICECWTQKSKSVDLSAQRFDKAEEDIKYLIEALKNEDTKKHSYFNF